MKQSNFQNLNFNLIKLFGVVFFWGIFSQLIAQDFNFNYAKSFGGSGNETIVDMSVDSAGNVVLLGYFTGSVDFDPSPLEMTKTSQGLEDIFVVKYNSNGQIMWANTFGSFNYDIPGGIDFDNQGNLVFSGNLFAPIDVDPSANSFILSNSGTSNGNGQGTPSRQGYIVKLSPEGNFIWANYSTNYFGSIASHLRINTYNEIIYVNSTFDLNWNYTGTHLNFHINKLNSDGNPVWSHTVGPTNFGQVYISDLEISNQNEIFLTGSFNSNGLGGVQIYQTADSYFIAPSNGTFVLKINSNGDFVFAQTFTNTFNLTIAAGPTGEFYLNSMTYNQIDINPNDVETYYIGNTPQSYLAKFSANGNFIWVKTFEFDPYSQFCTLQEISINSSGDLFISGLFNGQIDFNPSPNSLSLSTSYSNSTVLMFLLRLNSDGDYISKRIIGENIDNLVPKAAILRENGEYVITGTILNSATFNPNLEFIPDSGFISSFAPGYYDLFISKFSTCIPSNDSAIIFPETQNLCVNTSAQPLNLTYNGSSTPNYQWYFSNSSNNTDGTIIPGATSSTYSPPTNSPINYYYYCKSSINATGCSLNSASAHVTIVNAPNITSQAIADQTICIGGTPNSLTIGTSNPTGIDTYQWYSNSTNSNSGGVLIPGATSNSFTPINTSSVGITYYYCLVCGVTATNAFRINVVADPVISTQPLNSQTICLGGTPNALSTSVSGGTGVFAFQWFNAATNTPILGANSSSYTPSYFPSPNNYEYYLQVSQSGSGCNTLFSTNSTVTVIADPVVSASPASQSICTNGSISPLEVSSSGGIGTIFYQWYRTTNDSNSGGTAISGATSASYSPPTSLASNYYYYAAVNLSGSGCSVNSPTSLVAVNPTPSFSAQPIASQTVCVDGTPSALNVNYSNGAGTPTYQWWSNNVNSTNNATLISGANSASFIPNSSIVGTTYYFCTVTFSASNCGFITSNISSVTVVSDPVIASQPTGSIICAGGEANPLSVDVSGGVGTYTYQWYNSATGNSIAGATSALFYPGTFNTPSENSYFVQVNQSGAGCNTLTSSPALVSVVEAPTLSSNSPSYQIICEQSNIDSLEILVLGGTQLSYQWFIAPNSTSVGNPIANANYLIFTPDINSVSNNFYYCKVSSLGNGCTPSINSTPFQIEIIEQPHITNSAYSVETCLNNAMPALEIAGNYDSFPNIHFYQSSIANTYGGSEIFSTNFTPSSNSLGNYSYYFTYNVSYPGCLTDTSDFYNVTISEVPQLNLGSTEPIIGCVGAEIDLSSFTIPNLSNDYILVWNLDNNSSDTTYASNTYSTQPIEASGSHNMQVQMLSTLQYCSATDELNLSIDIVPDPSIAEEQNFIQDLCPFDENINAPTVLLDFDNSIGPPTYTWNQIEEGVLTPLANSNQNSYLPQLPMNGVFNAQCVVQFVYPGCDVLTSSLSTLTFDDNNLDCFPEIVIPEVISPNNDGMNDFWTIPGIEQFNGYEINIFNSFGQSIYLVKNTPPSWDGTWNGQTLPNGDYFYSVKLDELNRTIFGTVSVKK